MLRRKLFASGFSLVMTRTIGMSDSVIDFEGKSGGVGKPYK